MQSLTRETIVESSLERALHFGLQKHNSDANHRALGVTATLGLCCVAHAIRTIAACPHPIDTVAAAHPIRTIAAPLIQLFGQEPVNRSRKLSPGLKPIKV